MRDNPVQEGNPSQPSDIESREESSCCSKFKEKILFAAIFAMAIGGIIALIDGICSLTSINSKIKLNEDIIADKNRLKDLKDENKMHYTELEKSKLFYKNNLDINIEFYEEEGSLKGRRVFDDGHYSNISETHLKDAHSHMCTINSNNLEIKELSDILGENKSKDIEVFEDEIKSLGNQKLARGIEVGAGAATTLIIGGVAVKHSCCKSNKKNESTVVLADDPTPVLGIPVYLQPPTSNAGDGFTTHLEAQRQRDSVAKNPLEAINQRV